MQLSFEISILRDYDPQNQKVLTYHSTDRHCQHQDLKENDAGEKENAAFTEIVLNVPGLEAQSQGVKQTNNLEDQ